MSVLKRHCKGTSSSWHWHPEASLCPLIVFCGVCGPISPRIYWAQWFALLGKVPWYSHTYIKLLPSSVSKRGIWRVYHAAAEEDDPYCPHSSILHVLQTVEVTRPLRGDPLLACNVTKYSYLSGSKSSSNWKDSDNPRSTVTLAHCPGWGILLQDCVWWMLHVSDITHHHKGSVYTSFTTFSCCSGQHY